MKSADITNIKVLSRPSLSSDGRYVALGARWGDVASDTYRADLWVVSVDGSEPPRRLTAGYNDYSPRWSPDGRWLAFLRSHPRTAGTGGQPQLFLASTGGGQPFPITNLPRGVETYDWSPDSESIALLARLAEEGRYGTGSAGPREEPPRRITNLGYRRDLVGYKIDQRLHIFHVDVPPGPTDALPEVRQLTDGDFDHAYVSFSPDGRQLVFTSARHDDRDVNLAQDVFVIAADGGPVSRLTDGGLVCARPTFSPDGASIYFLGYDPGPTRRDVFSQHSELWSVRIARPGAPSRLTGPELYLTSDRSPDLPSNSVLIVDHTSVLVERPNRGAVDLVRITLTDAGGRPSVETLIAGERQVLGFDTGNGTLAAVVATDIGAGDLLVVDASGERWLTDFAGDLSRVSGLQEVTAVAPDGYPVHGWLCLPDGPGPHPSVVVIHGGPFEQWGWNLLDEVQVYATAGIASILVNERGSSGYGDSHSRAVIGQFGDLGAGDILSMVEEVTRRPELDAARVGVIGGSYGGYMVSWLVTHSERFAAAVSERALNALDSAVATSDIGYYYPETFVGTSVQALTEKSPLTYADDMRTPLLILHSEEDIDAPLEQAQRLYVALKMRGAPVELLVFPGEGHDLSRSGLPSHRVARLDAIVEWFSRHLH